ncbi:MAG: endonuclease/exonuclease/phosphatase family protein [Parvibaculum sp.]|nr:endonuclease/exonuclease/phosphatase family protein [Parvibaculum sp.]
MMRQTIRLLSWNIHGGIGADGRFDLARIVRLIERHDPDVIALQEVDSRGRAGDAAPVAFLSQSLGEHAAEARTISAPDGHYGHCVISRFPLGDIRVEDLSFISREPRCAIVSSIETPGGTFRLVTTHLGLSIVERRAQAKRLAALACEGKGPCIAMGDFNDWFAFGHVRRRLKRVMPQRTMERTFPAAWPLLRLDRIYCAAPVRLVASWTDPEAASASDHLPVIADVMLA